MLKWLRCKVVCPKGANDLVFDGDIAYTIVTAAAVSTDAAYSGLTVPNVAFTNVDNDRKGRINLTANEGGHNVEAVAITAEEPVVQAIIAQAAARWVAAGAEIAALSGVPILIADLPGKLLAQTDLEIIWIDADAAGWGWYLDPDPADDSEFLLSGDQGEQNRMDLLSAVMHEFGHLLGLDHHEEGPMQETLSAGMRTSGQTGHANELSAVDAAWADYTQSNFAASRKRPVQPL